MIIYVPQKVLDVFNKIDFVKLNMVQRQMFGLLENYIKGNLPMKQTGVNYPAPKGKRQIVKDFDRNLLNLLNNVDYARMNETQISSLLTQLQTYLKMLPKK